MASKEYYYQLPENKACEDYRRAIYKDVKDAKVNQFLWDFIHRIAEQKRAVEKKHEVGNSVQKAVWYVLESAAYCDAFKKLYQDLRSVNLCSEGMKAFYNYLSRYVLSEPFVGMHKQAELLKEQLMDFRIKLVYENDQLLVMEEAVDGTYEKFLKAYMGDVEEEMKKRLCVCRGCMIVHEPELTSFGIDLYNSVICENECIY